MSVHCAHDRNDLAGARRREPKVVVAHDYLTQRGGAERVALALLRVFPGARIVTSIYEPSATYAEFSEFEIQTSRLSKASAFRTDPRRALPLLANAWGRMTVDDADVVICSSSGWSHGITTTARKIVYCHNPARWLYQTQDYMRDNGTLARTLLGAVAPSLRRWDRAKAASAHLYLANSTAVAHRIARAYDRTAQVVHPPVALSAGEPQPVPGIEPGFLLTVGRARGYKHTDVIAQAVKQIPDARLVAVGGLPNGAWPSRFIGLTDVSDTQLRWLYANASALVACAHEDFGLSPIEAYLAGTPALVLRSGGYIDTTLPGVTGEFVDELRPSAIADGIRRIRSTSYSQGQIQKHAQGFSFEAFAARMRAVVDQVIGAREHARPADLPRDGAWRRPASSARSSTRLRGIGVEAGGGNEDLVDSAPR